MPEFTIEKNVPRPTTRCDGKTRFPFRDMEIGDSFAAPAEIDGVRHDDSLRSSARHWCAKYNPSRKFSVRNTPDGYRCWRVA